MARYCPNCGKELNGGDFCPACGTRISSQDSPVTGAVPPTAPTVAPTAPKRKRRGCLIAFLSVLVLAAVIAVIAALSNIGGDHNANAPANTGSAASSSPAATKAPNLELVGNTVSRGDGFSLYIDGSLRNNTGKQYSYVQITFGVYDANNNKLGTALANVNNLGAGETWKFSAIYFGKADKGSTYKLDDISAF